MGDFTTAGEVESVTAHEVINTITARDFECITGRKVMVIKAGSSILGLFSVVSDNHTISNGEHKVTLGLDFKGVKDEEE